MLQILVTLRFHKSHRHQVRYFLCQFSFVSSRKNLSTQSSDSARQTFFPCASTTDAKLKDLASIDFSVIKKEVLSGCAHSFDNFVNVKAGTFTSFSLKDYILELSCVSPEAIRRFWRVSALKPQDILEILLHFNFDSGKYGVEVKKIKSLWGMFRWASDQSRDFEHIPESYNIMAKMLVRVGLFDEAEYLLSRFSNNGAFLESPEIFSDLIEGYVLEFDLDMALTKYSQMRSLGLVPSDSCYLVLLECLVRMNEPQLAYQVCLDVVGMGFIGRLKEKSIFEKVVRLLCVHGKVQESRDLVKTVLLLEMQPTNVILDAIVTAYCKKKDYNDIHSFFLEVGVVPDITVGNKAIHSLSSNFGAERAYHFMQELEQLGFCPDEISFGILIGQSCTEGRLKNAFIYLSELLSRNLKPHVYSYNALISGLFKEGMWKQSYDILQEMKDSAIEPNSSTFKVLLAGFCKARQFSEVKKTLGEMESCGLVELSLLQDQLSAALSLLGVSPVFVKLRRDNDVRLSKTEFFDELGNGLYLDTDLHWFDKTMDNVLDDALLPNFNYFLLDKSVNRDTESALLVVNEMAHWGQELSLCSSSALLSRLSASRGSIRKIAHFLDKMSCSMYELDPATLNMLVQTYSKGGYTCQAKMIFYNLIRKQIEIENGTYTTLLMGLARRGDSRSLHNCWKLSRKYNWSPEQKDGKALLECLWQPKMLNVGLEILETFLKSSSYISVDVIYVFFKKLCHGGFTNAAYIFARELLQQGHGLDEVIYNYLASGFCKENKPAEALMIVDAMILNKHEPPLDVFSQLIPFLCRPGNFEKAVKLKDAYLETQPSFLLSAYGALINGCCKLGRVRDAIFLLHEIRIKKHLPANEMCNMLLQGYCQVNDLKRVGELLSTMIRKKLCMTISSYRNLVRLTCAAGKFSAALSLKKLIDTNFSASATYNILIFYLASSLNMTAVEEVIDELQMTGLQLEGVTYDFVIRGASHSKDSSRSLRYLRTMMSEGLRPSSRSLRKVMGCLCENGELEKALALSESMESRGWVHSSAVQNSIFEALLARGNLVEAVRFLDRMVAKNLIPRTIDYNHVIKRLCQHGQLQKANDLLTMMLSRGNVPNPTSFDSLIRGFCASNKLDLALDYHTEMIYRNLRPSSCTWETLVHGLSEAEAVAEAEKLLQWMVQKGETPSREMYSCVIHKYRSSNNLGKAMDVLRAMQDIGYEPDFETHWSLISNYRHPTGKENGKSRGFLSRLLSG